MSALFSCREAARLLSARQDRPLVLHERLSLSLHQAMCSACRAYSRQIRLIDHSFAIRARKTEDPVPVSEALGDAARERIRSALRQSCEEPTAVADAHPMPASTAAAQQPVAPNPRPPRPSTPRPSATHAAPPHRGPAMVGLALFFVAAVLGGTWYLQTSHCPSIGGRIQVAEHIAFHHRRQDAIEFYGTSLTELAQAMPRLDFVPRLPAALADAGTRIDGARYCTVGETIAMQVFLHQGGIRKSLYLARAIPEIPAHIGLVSVARGQTTVHLWREDDQFCGLAEDGPTSSARP